MLPVPGLSFLFISFLIHPARPITDFDSKKWDTRKRDFAKKKKKKEKVSFVSRLLREDKKNRNNYSKCNIYISKNKKKKKILSKL